MNFPDELTTATTEFQWPLVFATVSGAHLYGFPSPDSDYDLRGCHVLPLREVVGLTTAPETTEYLGPSEAIELDLVSHDLHKFCRLLLRRNGYVLEQLTSPHVVHTSAKHEVLKSLVPNLITRHHAHHYLGFAQGQWSLFVKQPRVKTLLYVYRVLLTGIHLMQSGRIEASLPALLDDDPDPKVAELIDMKIAGTEKASLTAAAIEEHQPRFEQRLAQLESARDQSHLPDQPTAQAALHDLIVTTRLATE